MTAKRARVGWHFFLLWVIASFLGFGLLGGLIGDAISRFTENLGFGLPTGAVFGVVLGLAGGTTQWLILRRQFTRAGWWVLACIVGFATSFLVVDAVIAPLSGEGNGLIGHALIGIGQGAVIGIVVGTGQWLVLRGRVGRPGRWVLVSILAWGVGLALRGVVDFMVGAPLDFLTLVIVSAILTGIGMVWLLRPSAPATQGAATAS